MLTLPDWLLALPRLVLWPIRWSWERVKRHAIDRQALVREGSAVVTPAIQVAKGLGPVSIMFGRDDQVWDYLEEKRTEWDALSVKVLTCGNHHPSERVRRLAHDAVDAVWSDYRARLSCLGAG